MRLAEIDTIGKMTKRRRHSTIHIVRVSEATQRTRLPFGRRCALCSIKRQLVLAAALAKASARKMQIAPDVVDFSQSAVVTTQPRQRFGLGQSRKGIVPAIGQSIGPRATNQGTAPINILAGF